MQQMEQEFLGIFSPADVIMSITVNDEEYYRPKEEYYRVMELPGIDSNFSLDSGTLQTSFATDKHVVIHLRDVKDTPYFVGSTPIRK